MLTASNCFSSLSLFLFLFPHQRKIVLEIMVSLYEIGRNAYVLSRCVGGAVKTLTIVEVLAGFLGVVIKLIVNLIKFLLVFSFLSFFTPILLFRISNSNSLERNKHCRFI